MCSTHAGDQGRFVCLSHRAAALRTISLNQWQSLSDEEQSSGLYMIDADLCDPLECTAADRGAQRVRDFRRDDEEERDGTYR